MKSLRHTTTAAAILAATSILAPLGGCEDSQVAAQKALRTKVSAAIEKADKAMPGGMLPTDAEGMAKAAQELRSAAQSLSDAGAAPAAAKSTAALLASTLNAQAAALDAVAAAQLETSLRMDRLAVTRAASAAAALDALAQPMEQLDFGDARTTLKARREAADGQLRQMQAELKGLQGALAQLNTQLEGSTGRSRQLELDANQLLVKSREVRPRQALPFVEQAADLQTQNARVRGDLGRQQAELTLLQPQLTSANSRADGTKALLAAADDAMGGLDRVSDGSRRGAADAKAAAARIRTEARKQLEALAAAMDDQLAQRYMAAAEGFGKAAQLAGQAANGADNTGQDSARLAAASANLSLGRMMAERAGVLAEHAALLDRLAAGGDAWGQPAQWSAAIEKNKSARQESIDKAKEAIQAASDSLDQLKTPALTNSAEVQGLKSRLAAAKLELENPGAGRASSPTAKTAGQAAMGSAEEFAAFLSSDGANPSAMAECLWSDSNPESVEMLKALLLGFQPLHDAVMATFKDQAPAAGFGPSTVTVVSVEGDTAQLKSVGPKGTETLKAVKKDGRWRLDAASVLEASAELQALNSLLSQMGPQWRALTDAMAKASGQLAAKVRAGDVKSMEELSTLTQQMMREAGKQGLMDAMQQGAAPKAPGAPAAPAGDAKP